MKTQTQQLKKAVMWYKVTELNSKRFQQESNIQSCGYRPSYCA